MLTTVGVDACIDPRADASIRPYKWAISLCVLAVLLRLSAVQFLFNFFQDGMLGVVQIAADLAPGSAGMPAAAQTP